MNKNNKLFYLCTDNKSSSNYGNDGQKSAKKYLRFLGVFRFIRFYTFSFMIAIEEPINNIISLS